METFFSAVILMGGEGKRLGSTLPKQFHPLGPLKVYQKTVKTFQESALFQEIILVCHPDWLDEVRQETAHLPTISVVCGGETRQASSWEGLQACNPACDYVMIHDAVRPFVSLEILQRNYLTVLESHAVDTCIASADTLLLTNNGTTIDSIPSRSLYRRGQTPQTFAYPLICKAHQTTSRQNATDDCQLVLDLDHPVAIVEGSEENLKITTEWDLELAQFIVGSQKGPEDTTRTPSPLLSPVENG